MKKKPPVQQASTTIRAAQRFAEEGALAAASDDREAVTRSHLQSLMELDETKYALTIAGWSGLACVLVTIGTLIYGPPVPGLQIWGVALIGIAVVTMLASILVRRSTLARRQMYLWRTVLFVVLLAMATGFGWPLLHVPAGDYLVFGLAAFGVLLSVAPLMYWPLGYFLLILLHSAAALLVDMAGDWLVPLLLIDGLLFLLGIATWDLLRRDRRARRSEMVSRQSIATLAMELSNQTDRADLAEEERLKLEKDLDVVREVADSAARAKTEFLATMSHEIRTPLNGILPILEILADTELTDKQRGYVSTAFNSSKHLLRIINDVLDFAKAESGKLELESIEVNLRSLVDSVSELMQRSAEKRGLRLHASVAREIPEVLRTDPIRLRQILINLVSNAIKFTPEGSIDIQVTKRRESRKEVELVFSVTDTGIGMTAETTARLFESFTQADASTTRKHGGTGLGLAICKRLVELMGGNIGVRSRLQHGSTFWFALPLRRSLIDVPISRRSLEGVRLLSLIRDEEVANVISGFLNDWGVIQEATDNPMAALEKLRSSAVLGKTWSYELLLVDTWGMEMQVISLMKDIRSQPELKSLRILVASRSENIARDLRNAPGVFVMEGALRPESLRRMMNRLFDVAGSASSYDAQTSPENVLDLNVELSDQLDDGLWEEPTVEYTPSGNEPRVLLVEDNPVNLAVMRKLLNLQAVDCDVAHDGKEAVKKIRFAVYDLILMDCLMPEMDGFEATREIRKMEINGLVKRMPIVAMTANAMAGDREKCLAVGMDDYIAKPVSIADLRGMLRKWMPQRKAESAPSVENASPDSRQEVKGVLDENIVHELLDVMGEDFFALVTTFRSHAPTLVEDIQQAIEGNDVEAMIRPAHSLKSSSANLGAMDLSGQAKAVELAARDSDFVAAVDAFASIPGLLQATDQALQQLQG